MSELELVCAQDGKKSCIKCSFNTESKGRTHESSIPHSFDDNFETVDALRKGIEPTL